MGKDQETSVGEDAEKQERLEPSCKAGGNVKGLSHCRTQFGNPRKIQHASALGPSPPTPMDTARSTGNGCSNKNVPTIVHNSQKAGTSQTSVNRGMNSYTDVGSPRVEYHLAVEGNEIVLHVATQCYNVSATSADRQSGTGDPYHTVLFIGNVHNGHIQTKVDEWPPRAGGGGAGGG